MSKLQRLNCTHALHKIILYRKTTLHQDWGIISQTIASKQKILLPWSDGDIFLTIHFVILGFAFCIML